MKVKCLRSRSSIFKEGEEYDAKLIKNGISIYKIESKKGNTLLSLSELKESKDFRIINKK